MMLPAYNIPTNTKDIEKNSKIIEIAIENLFTNYFLNRIKLKYFIISKSYTKMTKHFYNQPNIN